MLGSRGPRRNEVFAEQENPKTFFHPFLLTLYLTDAKYQGYTFRNYSSRLYRCMLRGGAVSGNLKVGERAPYFHQSLLGASLDHNFFCPAPYPCRGLEPLVAGRWRRSNTPDSIGPNICMGQQTRTMEVERANGDQMVKSEAQIEDGDANTKSTQSGVPVYVMLPLDTINAEGVFRYSTSRWFITALESLRDSGIYGVAVDVWWGAVERRPRRYDWSGYRQLFDLVASLGLKLQVVLAFHACGGNVGDNAEVPLPVWVVSCGERDPDLFFTDRPRELSRGQRNRECISLFAAEEAGILKGRSPLQCYVDFMRAFRDEFMLELGTMIEEVVIGTGPCGELRYPSYPETNGWRFPGIGEFQCYDRRALASLARAAAAIGRPDWGNAGPHDGGSYNSNPEETGFFRGWGGNWNSEYGHFFLDWYSKSLIDYGDRMLRAATSVFTVERNNRSTNHNGGPQDGGSDMVQSPGASDSLFADGYASTLSPRSLYRGEASTGSSDAMLAVPDPTVQAPRTQQGSELLLSSRPASYSSFKSSSVSEGLNSLEDWSWPSPAGPPVALTLKVAGVHWWYRTRSHAAELTAGYYNCEGRDGYEGIVALCAAYGVRLTLTCVEMCDSQHPPEALCGPEGLLRQVREAAAKFGVLLGGENALPCFMPNVIDEIALQRVVYNTQPWGTPLEEQGAGADHLLGGHLLGGQGENPRPPAMDAISDVPETVHPSVPSVDYRLRTAKLPAMRSFTFLRLTPEMSSPSYMAQWQRFMDLMSRNGTRFKSSTDWHKSMGFTQQHL